MTQRPFDNSPPRDLDAEALDWFARFGELAEPPRELMQWLDADPAHRQAYERWRDDWRALESIPAAGVQRLRLQLAHDKAAERQAKHEGVQPRRRWFASSFASGAALAMGVLLVSSGGFLAWTYWPGPAPSFAQTYQTARGEQRDVTLPDGSQLRLDTATQLDVKLYADRREVRIAEGQAIFQVKGDRARPFDVLAGPIKITVVGTRFSVRHTKDIPDDDGVRVAVEEGRVRVTPAQAWRALFTSAVYLGPGQQLVSDASGKLPLSTTVPTGGIAPWRDGMVSFVDTPLRQALAEFERYGPTGMRLHDSSVGALRLTGTFDPRKLDNFKRILPRVLPVRIERQDDTLEIAAAR